MDQFIIKLMEKISLEVIRDILQTFFYATASIVGWIGLKKWREELKGKIEYEAAKQALVQSYSIRDQIRIVQSPVMSPSEWSGCKTTEYETENQRKANESFFAYSKRFQELQVKISGMYPAMVEAEAVFGEESREKLDKLIGITRRLWTAILLYHRGLYNDRHNPEGANSRYFNIIYGINEVENPNLSSEEEPVVDDDNFKQDIDAAMQEIQEYFAPKLGHKPPIL
jgi:hypothetical protein